MFAVRYAVRTFPHTRNEQQKEQKDRQQFESAGKHRHIQCDFGQIRESGKGRLRANFVQSPTDVIDRCGDCREIGGHILAIKRDDQPNRYEKKQINRQKDVNRTDRLMSHRSAVHLYFFNETRMQQHLDLF